jgi:hypothetical protein
LADLAQDVADRLFRDVGDHRGRNGRRLGNSPGIGDRTGRRDHQLRGEPGHSGAPAGDHLLSREEIGIRGHLRPKLLPLGRNRALLVSGLVWATWHMPLLFLTPLIPVGNKVIGMPLFYAAVVAGSFFYGYLRMISGSLWPASIAHAMHNSAWGLMIAFTATSYPVLVNSYLLGDSGILITVGAAAGAVLVGRMMPRGGKARPDATPPVLESVTSTTATAASRQV